MTPTPVDYPELYDAADRVSQRAQQNTLALVLVEYGVAIAAALLAWVGGGWSALNGLFALAFLMLTMLALMSFVWKPVQTWYRGRALAESVKTLTWRFMMRAAPFETEGDPTSEASEFARH